MNLYGIGFTSTEQERHDVRKGIWLYLHLLQLVLIVVSILPIILPTRTHRLVPFQAVTAVLNFPGLALYTWVRNSSRVRTSATDKNFSRISFSTFVQDPSHSPTSLTGTVKPSTILSGATVPIKKEGPNPIKIKKEKLGSIKIENKIGKLALLEMTILHDLFLKIVPVLWRENFADWINHIQALLVAADLWSYALYSFDEIRRIDASHTVSEHEWRLRSRNVAKYLFEIMSRDVFRLLSTKNPSSDHLTDGHVLLSRLRQLPELGGNSKLFLRLWDDLLPFENCTHPAMLDVPPNFSREKVFSEQIDILNIKTEREHEISRLLFKATNKLL
ncbi:MAG: hypothetical protein Q9184_005667 [Pyrenodesmia sp. 2 TL-2023]